MGLHTACAQRSARESINGDEGREGVADVATDDKVCDVVEIGRLAVDDHQRRAVALGHQRKPGRRPDHQRGADGQE